MSSFEFLNPAKAVRAAKVREGMHVADFGVGSGFFTRASARAVGNWGKIYALDIDRELLKRARTLARAEGLENIEYVRGDLEQLHGSNLPDESVDMVILSNVLFQVPHKEKMIEEAWRALRHGGRALAIDWKDSFGGLGPHPLHVLREGDAKKLFERGGFSFLESVPAGDFHYGFILRKK